MDLSPMVAFRVVELPLVMVSMSSWLSVAFPPSTVIEVMSLRSISTPN